jgi:N-acetylglucosaminyl-diphospho-decaprenol L-rhamnosyltransferase
MDTGPAPAAASEATASVVMVSFRTGPVLWQAIDAALADPATLELVLVDNGNPPDDTRMIDTVADREPRLRVLRGHGNVGFARACNAGAAVARGKVLVFLNPDARALPGAIARLALSAEETEGLVGGLLVDGQGREQRGSRRGELTALSLLVHLSGLGRPGEDAGWRRAFNRDREPLPQQRQPVPTVSGACMAIRRVDFDAVGGFDPRYFLHFEDVALCRSVRASGRPVVIEPSARIVHTGASSRTSAWWPRVWKLHGLFQYLFVSSKR